MRKSYNEIVEQKRIDERKKKNTLCIFLAALSVLLRARSIVNRSNFRDVLRTFLYAKQMKKNHNIYMLERKKER